MKKLNKHKYVSLFTIFICSFIFILLIDHFTNMDVINSVIEVILIMAFVVYIGWLNSSIISLKKKVKELESKISN